MGWHQLCRSSSGKLNSHQNVVQEVEDFFTIENLGLDCNPRCGRYRCGTCSFKDQYSVREQLETNLIVNILVKICL